MDPEIERKIDEIMYETNDKINAIVSEMRQIRFSKMTEDEKRVRCDELREKFEEIMLNEETKIKKIMKEEGMDS